MMPQNWVGKTIDDRYQIETLLGQGGMSAVYQAIDPNLRRPVAIKLIHPHLSTNPNFIYRFKEEAAAVARLRHPNIVQVYDFNADGDTYFMVMEYLIGETLQARLKRNNAAGRYLPYTEVTRICLQLCDAVGYAHNHELIHRDIKPANIILDVNNQAILLDFGIVKIVGGEYHTVTGATIGTAMYMSPEQMRSERVDDRSDIYSLGVTLFEMISGQPPYQADSTPSLMMMVLNDPLPDLSEIRTDVPEELVLVVQKAITKDRAERFQTMDEMATAIKRVEERLGEYKPAETAVDDGESVQSVSKSTQPHEGATIIDTSPEERISADHPVVIQEQGQVISPLPTVQDQPEKLKPAITQPDKTKPVGKVKLLSRRNVLIAAGLLLVLVIAIGGYLLIDSRQPPDLDLAPITRPPSPMNAQNAQFVVSLGKWETNSDIGELAISPDGKLLGTSHNRKLPFYAQYRFYSGLWQLETGTLQRYLFGHSQVVNGVAFSPDGQLFATASSDDTVLLWQVSTGEMERMIETSAGGINSVAFSPNNLMLAAGSWDGYVSLWQLSNGNLLRRLQRDDNSIYHVEFSPDGELLAAAAYDNTAMLWSVSDGSLLHTLQGHTAPVYSVAFSADGTLLASASEDGTIVLWQVSDGSLLRTIKAHTDAVYDVAFSPDGSLLASGSGDGALRLWRVTDGQPLNLLIEEAYSINSVAFSPDSVLLVSGSEDGRVQFWGISEAISLETE